MPMRQRKYLRRRPGFGEAGRGAYERDPSTGMGTGGPPGTRGPVGRPSTPDRPAYNEAGRGAYERDPGTGYGGPSPAYTSPASSPAASSPSRRTSPRAFPKTLSQVNDMLAANDTLAADPPAPQTRVVDTAPRSSGLLDVIPDIGKATADVADEFTQKANRIAREVADFAALPSPTRSADRHARGARPGGRRR